MSKGRDVIVQKPLFHRQTGGQTDNHVETSNQPPPPHTHTHTNTHTTSLAGYKNLFSMWRNRWKMTPPPLWCQNFMVGVTFSRPFVQNLMLKFDPCQLLTLKNDPGSHFPTGSLFNVTPVGDLYCFSNTFRMLVILYFIFDAFQLFFFSKIILLNLIVNLYNYISR